MKECIKSSTKIGDWAKFCPKCCTEQENDGLEVIESRFSYSTKFIIASQNYVYMIVDGFVAVICIKDM